VKKNVLLMSAAALLSLAAPALAHDGKDHSKDGPRVPTGDLRDLVADLYGGNGITLDPGIVFHAAHFSGDAQEQLNNLSQVIASSIGGVTFNSTVSAISFDIEEGVPVRSQESLGPLIAERASTIGKGRFNLGVSYTNIDYKQLDGRSLNELQITLTHDREFNVPYENDVIVLDLDLELQQQVLAFYGTYGLTNSIDLGIVLPLQKIEGSVTSVARIIDNGGEGIHRFGGTTSAISTNRASATGIGDILLRAKWDATQGTESPIGLGLLTQVSLPTGDERDLLGSGAAAVYVAGIASTTLGRFSPHLNIGYEKFIDENDGIRRSNLRGVAGFDLKARDNFSVAAELIGRFEDDGDKFYDLALGTKWAPTGDVPISFNLVVPMNRNSNLRPDFYFTVGLESTF
jgi:hypothetical protein